VFHFTVPLRIERNNKPSKQTSAHKKPPICFPDQGPRLFYGAAGAPGGAGGGGGKWCRGAQLLHNMAVNAASKAMFTIFRFIVMLFYNNKAAGVKIVLIY
jgi:hypothetical protein